MDLFHSPSTLLCEISVPPCSALGEFICDYIRVPFLGEILVAVQYSNMLQSCLPHCGLQVLRHRRPGDDVSVLLQLCFPKSLGILHHEDSSCLLSACQPSVWLYVGTADCFGVHHSLFPCQKSFQHEFQLIQSSF